MATNTRFSKSLDNAKNNTEENIKETTKNRKKENIIGDKLSGNILKRVLENEKKPKGTNHTLYLSAEVSEALTTLSKQSKKSKSTLVDEILREILLSQ